MPPTYKRSKRKTKPILRLAAVADPETGLPALTAKQEKFALGILHGLSAYESYRKAYNVRSTKPISVSGTASHLASHPRIVQYIRFHQRIGLEQAIVNRENHLAELARLRELAVENTQISAGVQAEHYRGRVAGLYNDRLSVAIGPTDEALLSQIATLLGPEMAESLSDALGVERKPRESDESVLLALPSPLDTEDDSHN